MTIPNGWTTAICEAIRVADHPKVMQHRAWHLQLRSLDGELTCAYCLAVLDPNTPKQTVINYLVPLQLGGPLINENRVASCFACARSKGNRDLVSWQGFARLADENQRRALLDQRSYVLARAPNHLTHTRANAPKATVLRELVKRWNMPRFTLYALHGTTSSWIGWTTRNGAKEALGLAAVLLRFSCQAVPTHQGKITLYELPSDRFLDAIWLLIEHHALVKQMVVDGVEAVPQDVENWQHFWPVHLDKVGDLCRRRARKTGNNSRSTGTFANAKMKFFVHGIIPDEALLGEVEPLRPAPRKPRELSSKPAAICQRKRAQRKAVVERHQSFLEARASLDAFKERVRQGKLVAPEAWEMDLMEREVLALLTKGKGG